MIQKESDSIGLQYPYFSILLHLNHFDEYAVALLKLELP